MGPVGAAGPGLARGVGLRGEGGAIGARTGQHVVLVGRVAAALDDIASFVERRLLAQVVAVVQMRQITRSQARPKMRIACGWSQPRAIASV